MDFQAKLASVNLNDEQSIVNLLTAWEKTIPSPKDDILDGRRLCGDVDANGKTLDGNQCVTILQQCLTTDGNDCIKKFNTLQWDQQINVDTMDYYVARNLAKHLGFYDQPVLDAVKAVKETTGKDVNDNVLLLFNAIKQKINKVEKIKNKFDIVIPTEKVPTMKRRLPRMPFDGMFGGGITSYNDLIINLDTIKVNLSMNGGGSDTSILIKTSLTQLIQLLEKEGKKIDDNDLARIHQYISSLERSENKLKKVRDYINILIKAIVEKGHDVKTAPNVTLDFLQKFAEKESELIKTTTLKVNNLVGTFQIVIDSSHLKK
jgi:hypothetical protein